ncbi:MAG: S-layer homology domain-containing protein [Clostridia bacterium]|nr:S-layer homology domain-containing protein [Clostridia bacterium]
MLKRIAAILLATFTLCGIRIPALAEQYNWQQEIVQEPTLIAGVNGTEMLKNGNLETTVEDGKQFYKWGILAPAQGESAPQNFLGGTVAKLCDKRSGTGNSAIVNGGNRALMFTTNNENPSGYDAALIQGFSLNGTEEGVLCEASASVYPVTSGANAYIRMDILGTNNTRLAILTLPFSDCPAGQWSRKTMRLVLGPDVKSITYYVMMDGVASAIFDDISFVADIEPAEIERPMPEKKDPLPGTPANLLRNGDFEVWEDTSVRTANWRNTRNSGYSTNYNRTPGGMYSYLLEPQETPGIGFDALGQQAVYFTRKDEAKGQGLPLPEINEPILEPGATYQAAMYVLSPTENEMNFSFEFFWYSAPSPTVNKEMHYSTKGHKYYTSSEDWQLFVFEFVAPEIPAGDIGLSGLFRIRCMTETGQLYVDDVSLYMVKEADAMFDTDEAIYYTEWETGIANLSIKEKYLTKNADLIGGTARFRLMDGTRELHREDKTITGTEPMEYVFPTNLMTANKWDQTYRVEVQLITSAGQVIQTNEKPIYRFDRPTYQGEDGIFRKNGKEYYLHLGNGVNMERLAMHPKYGGVTIVQIVADSNIPILEKLDRVLAEGNLAMISLYSGQLCAGSTSRLDMTVDIVNTVKAHPALWGYKVQDEPTQKGNTDEELLRAYVTIRQLDPHHPIYLDDSPYGKYKKLARYADVIDIDYYPNDSANQGKLISNVLSHAYEATRGRKPFMLLQQAFVFGGSTYLPDVNAYRHFAYQTLFEGGAGWGYHSLGSDDGAQQIFMSRPVWQDICAWKQSGEMDLMMDAFVGGKYPLLNAYEDDSVMWRTFVRNGKIVAFVINRRGNYKSTDSLQVHIPLCDFDGVSRVAGFSASCLYGGTGSIAGSVTLSITVEDFTATVWEITPTGSADFSKLYSVKYDDLLDTPWAYQSIACLKNEGIINEKTTTRYAPKENVTRGDYAMFLVKTLGLTSSGGSNFSDVPSTAPYAEAIKIGKNLGILQGTGNNLFQPETPITRQELMTITARGMKAAGLLEEEGEIPLTFTDSHAISDWAVASIAAMVRLGVIRGNADGTVNPLGNTTRAEAAVIAARVRAWHGGEP